MRKKNSSPTSRRKQKFAGLNRARHGLALFTVVAALFSFFLLLANYERLGNFFAFATEGTHYYLDCAAGNDSNTGTAPTSAWKSLSKASNAPLQPGDNLLLKTDCTWQGTLKISQNGSDSKYITIGKYGAGAAPIITSNQTYAHAILLSGSYVMIDGLHLVGVAPKTDTTCQVGQTTGVGEIYGISFTGSSSSNKVQRTTIEGFSYGINIAETSSRHLISHNQFLHNNMMIGLSNNQGDDDYGANAVVVRGDNNEIAFNTFVGHDACSYDYGRDGSAVEIYGGKNNVIHHNIARQNDAFTELGHSRSANNTYAYNLAVSSLTNSKFLVTRGAKSSWGPIYGTKAYNNTIYFTGSTSAGFTCSNGCGGDVLASMNNIIWAQQGSWGDAAYTESHNIYWRSDGKPYTTPSSVIGSNSLKANPLFVHASTQESGNFSLSATSPAVDAGLASANYLNFMSDLMSTSIPAGAGLDIGAIEYAAAATTPSPSPTASPNPSPNPTPISTVDTELPMVELTSPAEGEIISKGQKITAKATASDNIGIAKVKFYSDGKLKCTDLVAPYECGWKSSNTKGTHTVEAQALDDAGNTNSSVVTYTIQ